MTDSDTSSQIKSQESWRPAASLVIEHTVPAGEGLAFRWWHSRVTRAAKNFEGHIRSDLCAPVKGQQPDQPLTWYSIVHFESSELLDKWINSRDRSALIKSGRKTFASYQFISFSTGLEGWFSRPNGNRAVGIWPTGLEAKRSGHISAVSYRGGSNAVVFGSGFNAVLGAA